MPRLILAFVLLFPSLVLAQPLPRVVVLATGGTIASTYDKAKGGFVAALSGADLIAANPALAGLARIEVEQIANIASTDLTSEIWQTLARRASARLAEPDVAGVVVTHGTDTLEETAYFLDLTVTSDKPVVVVGAQRAASEPDSDGPRNLRDAVRVAVSAEAVGKGTLVVMNGRIEAARDVTKTHTLAVETFRTLEFGTLGVVDPDAVRFYRAPTRRQRLELPAGPLATVEIVMGYLGADGRVLRALLADGGPPLAGVVIEGLGLGHVSGAMAEVIAEARRKGLAVVIATRVPTGRVLPLYASKGGGVSLQKLGCVRADNLSARKARVLLMLALAQTSDPAQLQQFFDR